MFTLRPLLSLAAKLSTVTLLSLVACFGRAETPPAPSAPPSELDRQIQQVLQERKYTWRIPREKAAISSSSEKGPIGRFVERVQKMVRDWAVSLRNSIRDWVRKHSSERDRAYRGGGSSSILSIHALIYALIAVVAIALGILLFRVIRKRGPKEEVQTSEPIQPVPDLADENIGAEHLPEDGWTAMGREFIERGEFRLALRAFYLASLAHLASRNLISLARFKSNSDYQRELQRRAHSLPDLLQLFRDNVGIFDRVWYGLHAIDSQMTREFLARVEQIKSGVTPSQP